VELVRRVEARPDLAPLLEFDRGVYGSAERVRLQAGDDGEVYYVPLDGSE
jgi:hypothetical protein